MSEANENDDPIIRSSILNLESLVSRASQKRLQRAESVASVVKETKDMSPRGEEEDEEEIYRKKRKELGLMMGVRQDVRTPTPPRAGSGPQQGQFRYIVTNDVGLAERDRTIATLESTISYLREQLVAQDHLLKQKDEEIASLRSQLASPPPGLAEYLEATIHHLSVIQQQTHTFQQSVYAARRPQSPGGYRRGSGNKSLLL